MYDNDNRIKLVRKLETTDISGEKVMIDFESGKYFMLKGVANAIWDMIQDEITFEEITNALLDEYDVDKETCVTAVNDFIHKLDEYKFIEVK